MSESFPRRARLWRYLGYAAGAVPHKTGLGSLPNIAATDLTFGP